MASNRDIPFDIIEYSILPRLPSKSLLKCLSVSKTWYSSIKNPKFIASHLNHHKSLSRHPNNHLTLLRCVKPSVKNYLYRHHKPSVAYYLHRPDNPACRYTKLRSPPPKSYQVVASYDGFVWLYDDVYSLLLWNPSIGKSRLLPRLPKVVSSVCAFGFGYNSLEDNYKLVVFNFRSVRSYFLSNDPPWGYPAFARVCTLNRKGEECSVLYYISLSKVFAYVSRISKCCFVNDMIHWIIFRDNIDNDHDDDYELDSVSIMTFDPKTDCFGEIMFPDINTGNQVELGVINDSVAVVEFREKYVVVVWRMDECKAWKVLYKIELSRSMNRRTVAKERCIRWLSSSPLPVTRFISTKMFRKHQHQVVITTSSGTTLIVFNDANSGNSGVFKGALATKAGEAYSYTESLMLLD